MSPRAHGGQHSNSTALEVTVTAWLIPLYLPPLYLVTGFVLKISSFYVALDDLELTVIFLSLSPRAEIKVMGPTAWLKFIF